MTCVYIAEVCKSPEEVRQWTIDLTSRLERVWEASTIYDYGDVVRPLNGPTGFEYAAENDGQTGREEPKWRASTKDAAITWTQQAISNASLLKTIASVAWSVPSGITLSGSGIEDVGGRQAIHVRLAGGTHDVTYLVRALVTFSDATEEEFGLRVSVEEAA